MCTQPTAPRDDCEVLDRLFTIKNFPSLVTESSLVYMIKMQKKKN